MSKQIDERVLKMEFDNQQFESNVKTSMSTLDKLKKALKMDGAEKGLSDVNAAAKKIDFSPMGSAVDTVKAKFSALEVMAVTALANITNSAVNAGKNLVKSFTIEPIKTGLDEYETKINSIQTIMSNTASKGTKMEDVTRVINELNTYADKTIYNFSEMTRNIGTFTAAGVGLEESAAAIQGIANLAAASGSSSQQASTAMYQLSQALAAGTVKLMDWNSVVNAGMGGEKFQEALKATAREHGIAVDDIIKQEGSFRDSLQKGWITADILNETLNKFTVDGAKKYAKSMMESGKWTQAQADALIKEAQSMEDAATKVKTFTQLMDTLKESAQSGWGQSWEIIIGNFEEAKELWTQVSDVIGGMINDSADARNKLLQGWKDMGGRKDLIDGIANAFNALMAVIKPIKEAFSEIFPPATAEQLVAITRKFKELTEGLKISDETAAKIKSTFKGLFAGLDIGVGFIKSVISGIVNLIGHITGLSGGFLAITGAIGNWISKLRDSIKGSDIFNKAITTITNVIGNAIDKVKGFGDAIKEHLNLESIGTVLSKIGSGAVKVITAVANALASVFKGGGTNKFFDIFNKGAIAAIFIQIYKFINGLGEKLGGSLGIIDNIKGIFSGVKDAIDEFQKGIKIKQIKQIAVALAILAGSLWVLASIDPQKLTGALGSITVLFGELMGAMEWMSRMKTTNDKQISKLASSVVKMSVAVFILASALKKIGELSPEQLVAGLFGITVLLGELTVVAKILSSDKLFGTKTQQGLGQMIFMAIALKILASACGDLGKLSWNQLAKGVSGIGVMLGEFVGFFGLLNKIGGESGQMIGAAISMTLIAAAMKIFASACSDLGNQSWEQLAKGVSVIGVILAEFAGFSGLLDLIGASAVSMIAASVSLIIIATAMEKFADVAAKFGKMDWGGLGKAGAAITAILGLCAAFSAIGLMGAGVVMASVALIGIAAAMEIFADVASKFGDMEWGELEKAGAAVGGLLLLCAAFSTIGLMGPSILLAAAALLVMATALRIFVPVLTTLGGMSWGEIGTGLLALAGAIVVLGGAAVILGILSPLLLAAGLGLTAFGIGCIAVGAGVLMLSTGLIGLSAAATAAGGSIKSIAKDFATTIPALMTGLGEGLVAMVTTIADSAGAITEAATKIVISLCDAIIAAAPKLVDAGVTIIMSLLDGLNEVIPKAVDVALNLVTTLINSLSSRIGEITQAGANLAINFINSIADGIRNNYAAVNAAILNVISACVEAAIGAVLQFLGVGQESVQEFAQGIMSRIGSAVAAIGSVIRACIQAAAQTATALFSAGVNLIQGFINGIKSKIGAAKAAISEGISGIVEKARAILNINSPSKVFAGIGSSVVEGLAKGIIENLKWSENASVAMAKGVVNAVEKTLEINSPSKVMIKEGQYIVEGIAEGITDDMSAEEAAKKKAENIVSAFQTVFDRFQAKIDLSSAMFDLYKAQHPNASSLDIDTQELEFVEKKIENLRGKQHARMGEIENLEKQLAETTDEDGRLQISDKIRKEYTELIKLNKELEETTLRKSELQRLKEVDPYIDRISKLNDSLDLLKDVAELNKLEFERWDSELDENATAAQKAARVVAELTLNVNNLSDQTRVAEEKARLTALAYGEFSDEARDAQEAYLKLVNESIAKNKELKSAMESVDDVAKSQYNKAREDYKKWIKDNEAGYLKAGYSYETILEMASKMTGYDPSKSVTDFKKEYNNALHDMTANGGLTMGIPVELQVEPDTIAIDEAAQKRIAQTISGPIQNGVTTVVAGTNQAIASTVTDGMVVINGSMMSVAEEIASHADEYKSAGEQLGESIITGIQMGMAYTDENGITQIIDFDELRARYQGSVELLIGNINPKTSYDAAVASNNPIDTNMEISVDNSDVVEAIDGLSSRVDRLGEDVGNLKVYLDTGVLVGQITPAVDQQLGMTATLKERG